MVKREKKYYEATNNGEILTTAAYSKAQAKLKLEIRVRKLTGKADIKNVKEITNRGMEKLESRLAHNQEVAGSSPAAATKI